MSAGLVCVNTACSRAGYAANGRPTCQTCGQPTRRVDEPRLVVPSTTAQATPAVETLEKVGDIGSRIMYGGFWVVVAFLGVVGGFLVLTQGNAIGLAGIGIGGLAGFYARYIIKGGRFRLLFW